jgi:hypothetical protein
MSDFERVAEQLIGLSLKVIDLIKTKNEYARSVNYQMGQLFEQLGESSDHGGVPFIETQNLRRQLSQSQLDLLFCRENRESSYLTPEEYPSPHAASAPSSTSASTTCAATAPSRPSTPPSWTSCTGCSRPNCRSRRS